MAARNDWPVGVVCFGRKVFRGVGGGQHHQRGVGLLRSGLEVDTIAGGGVAVDLESVHRGAAGVAEEFFERRYTGPAFALLLAGVAEPVFLSRGSADRGGNKPIAGAAGARARRLVVFEVVFAVRDPENGRMIGIRVKGEIVVTGDAGVSVSTGK